MFSLAVKIYPCLVNRRMSTGRQSPRQRRQRPSERAGNRHFGGAYVRWTRHLLVIKQAAPRGTDFCKKPRIATPLVYALLLACTTRGSRAKSLIVGRDSNRDSAASRFCTASWIMGLISINR